MEDTTFIDMLDCYDWLDIFVDDMISWTEECELREAFKDFDQEKQKVIKF